MLTVDPPERGWLCPACGSAHAPSVQTCPATPAAAPLPFVPAIPDGVPLPSPYCPPWGGGTLDPDWWRRWSCDSTAGARPPVELVLIDGAEVIQ